MFYFMFYLPRKSLIPRATTDTRTVAQAHQMDANAKETRRLHVPAAVLNSAQVRRPLDSSKQARTTQVIGGARTAHNFSPKALAYDYYYDYDDSYDYYDYEHMQEVRV